MRERLSRYGRNTVQYEEGLAVARRIRASRYLGPSAVSGALYFNSLPVFMFPLCVECSSKHNRGVAEVFYEAARVSLSTRPKGSGEGCVVM